MIKRRVTLCALAAVIALPVRAAETPPSAGSNPLAATSGPPVVAPAFVVTATRAPRAVEELAVAVDEFGEDFFRTTPALTIDDALRSSAAFSLFRRTGSLTANPTAQGVSLRGLGPSGASRSLVLLDGVPLNDPFGGWVAWSKVPQLGLRRAEIVRGGGSGAWGNAALGGAVQLFSPPPTFTTGSAALEIGSFNTRRVEALAAVRLHNGAALSVGGRWFATDGCSQFDAAQRGLVDERLDSRHTLGYGGLVTTLRSGLRFTATARVFDEARGNGTPLQRNESRERFAHVRLEGDLRPGLTLDALAYGQRQHFASGFSAVDAARTSETPSLDQFDVPASAWGGAVVLTWSEATDVTTTLGIDARSVAGETRENFFFSAGQFLRQRVAGGDQFVGGAFAAHQRRLAPGLSAQLLARLDRWTNTGGRRREEDRDSGTVLRDDPSADSDDTEFSPGVGLVWQAAPDWRVRASAYRAFRVPTLNELHRPFRVGNVATEANAALQRESVTGAEAGTVFTRGGWRVQVSAFHNDMHDGVANVTLSSTPALTQRQRLNLDSIRVRGLEAGVAWDGGRLYGIAFDYLLSDTRVRRADIAPDLVGRRLAQVPRHTATLQVRSRVAENWDVHLTARAASVQYEDDENALPLAGFVTIDLALRWSPAAGRELTFSVENVCDERVEAARTVGGLVSLGPPLLARLGFTAAW